MLSEVVFEDDGTGTFSAFGTLTITEEQARRISDDFPNLYINVHTAEFPAGAIRGNLGTEVPVLPPI